MCLSLFIDFKSGLMYFKLSICIKTQSLYEKSELLKLILEEDTP